MPLFTSIASLFCLNSVPPSNSGRQSLVAMGGDSCSDGHGYKSHSCSLDKRFSYLFVVKFVIFVLNDKKNEKVAGKAHLKIQSPVS